MRKFLIMSALVLGMAALTTTEVKAGLPPYELYRNFDASTGRTFIYYSDDTIFVIPPRPGYTPPASYPWDYTPWQNPIPN